jgi:hypothetical protein
MSKRPNRTHFYKLKPGQHFRWRGKAFIRCDPDSDWPNMTHRMALHVATGKLVIFTEDTPVTIASKKAKCEHALIEDLALGR